MYVYVHICTFTKRRPNSPVRGNTGKRKMLSTFGEHPVSLGRWESQCGTLCKSTRGDWVLNGMVGVTRAGRIQRRGEHFLRVMVWAGLQSTKAGDDLAGLRKGELRGSYLISKGVWEKSVPNTFRAYNTGLTLHSSVYTTTFSVFAFDSLRQGLMYSRQT